MCWHVNGSARPGTSAGVSQHSWIQCERFHEGAAAKVIAFATSLVIAIALDVAVIVYGKRRRPGQPLSWGEAMAASVFAFLVMMLWYGVIPHQWITLADAEWGWRADRLFVGPGDIFESGRFIPFQITYVVLRDFIVLAIYGAGLGLQIFHWVQWQNRGKATTEVVPTTAYGRPLVKKF